MAATTTPSSNLSTALGDQPGIERLYDNIQSEIPAVLLPALKLAAWNTIEDFYIRSTVKRQHIYWRMPANVPCINLDPYDSSNLVDKVLSCCGLARFEIDPPALIRDLSFPIPTVERKGDAWVVLKPLEFDSAISDGAFPELWSSWFEVILDGVRMRLYAQPIKPYSSPKLAEFYGRSYRSGIARARDYARRGYTANSPYPMPYFAKGRQ